MSTADKSSTSTHKCDWCGDTFDTEQGLKTHIGMKHVTLTRECVECGEEFRYPPSRADQKRCDDCTDRTAHANPPGIEWTDERRAAWAEMYTGEGNPFYGRTHSEETREILRVKCPFEAEEHWNWQGGRDLDYPIEFNETLKDFIRKLHFERCQLCGVHQNQLDRKHDVHHMNGNKDDLRWSNLYPFCQSCHQVIEHSEYS